MSKHEERLQRAAEDMAASFNKSPEETIAALKSAIDVDHGPIWWLMGYTQGWLAAQALHEADA